MTFTLILKFLQGRSGTRIYVLFLILLLISIYEVLFAFSLIPYFSFIIFGALPNLSLLESVSQISSSGIHALFWFFVVFRLAVQSLQAYIVSWIVYNVMSLGIKKSFRHFLLSVTDGSDEARIIVKDNEFISMYVAFPVVNIIFEEGVLLFAGVAMLVFYPIAILMFILFIMCIAPLIFYARLLQRKYSNLRVEYDSKVFREISSFISNKRFISTLQLSDKASTLVGNLTEKLKVAYSNQYIVQILSKNFLEAFVLVYLAFVIFFANTIEQTLLFIIFTIFLRMAQSATRLQMHIQTLQFGSESLHNYIKKLSEESKELEEIVFLVEDIDQYWRVKNIRNNKTIFLKKNNIYRLSGPSGSGKSTILNSIDSSLVQQKYVSYRFVPQFTSLRAGTLEDLDSFYSVDQATIDIDSFLLDELKVKDADLYRELDVISKTISGGEAQKLICRVLYNNNSKLLIVDELFSNLAFDQEEKLLLLLKKKFETIIYTSHKATIEAALEISVDELK